MCGPAACARRSELLARQVVEQRLALLEVRGDDRLGKLEQLERPAVLDAVVDARALAAALDEPLLAERRELLRRPARVELERLLQRSDRPFALTQELQDPYPHRVPQRAEELCLQGE